MAVKALEKPFLACEQIFRFKRYINLNIFRGDLYILNIRLKDSVFVQEISRFMQELEVEALLFECRLSMDEFGRFVDRFVKRLNQSDVGSRLANVLQDHNIDTIEVNSERGFMILENNKKYRGDVQADYSVQSMVLQRLGCDVTLLAQVAAIGQAALDEYGIDFDLDIVRYLLPEKVASLDYNNIRAHLSGLANDIAEENDSKNREPLEQAFQAAMGLTAYHPDRKKIVHGLEDSFDSISTTIGPSTQTTTPSSSIRLEVGEAIDQIIVRFLYEDDEAPDSKEFTNCFSRLLKTGQQGKAIQVLGQLMDMLEAPQPKHRQNALAMVEGVVTILDLASDASVCEAVINRVIVQLEKKSETYEYSDIIWRLIEKGMTSQKYDMVARLTKSMAARRRFADAVTIYDSMAVKHAFSNINRPEVIGALVDDMIKSDHETAGFIQETLVAVGTEQVALALANIISHPIRQIRQQTLRILAELGKASLTVFARIMADDSMFKRQPDRHELQDARWYVVRNTIFVLGSLKDPEGVGALRLRIDDKDIRVRREIVRSLEKIGGEDACDLLIVMADDRDREISESAVIAAGIIGRPDSAALFIDVARRHPSLSARCVFALGKLGGSEASGYLIKLLGCEDELSRLVGEGVSKDELRVAVIKALGNIGDEAAISSLQQFREGMSRTQKLFLKNSPVNRAIREQLD